MKKLIAVLFLWNIILTGYAGFHTYVGLEVVNNFDQNQREIGTAVYDLVIWKGKTEVID